MKAKPVFTIGVSIDNFNNVERDIKDIKATLGNEYHVLLYSHDHDDTKFNCYNAKDLTELDFNRLKEEIIKAIK